MSFDKCWSNTQPRAFNIHLNNTYYYFLADAALPDMHIVLYSVIACGTKDFPKSLLVAAGLNQSVREGAVSGAEGGLTMMDNSLFTDLLSTTASKVSSSQPITEPTFLISLYSLSVSRASPADHSKVHCARHSRLIENIQYFAQLPQEKAHSSTFTHVKTV